ncbi:sensor histidine kinase [Pseudomonas sp. SCB32]|uniref:sensor histidine kinase n=1 Tax=Pseudomonas sp. SCB32 TaxID=2653853 RepID=UPI0015B663DE|nr:sensor histidine kinase [Pseudomonas sp. SCB32]
MNGVVEDAAAQPAIRIGWLRFNGHLLRQHRRHLLTLVVPWLLLLLLGLPLLWNELERVAREPVLRARDSVREETVQILTRNLDLLRHDVVFLADLPPELISSDTRPDSVAARLFLSFSRSSINYEQVRWIDEHGDERLRVDNRDGHAELAPPEQLQNRADAAYFSEAVGLPAGSVYFSELDLSTEHGVIEQPLQPTLRVVSPVLDQGNRRGVVVLNYRAQRLLDRLRQLGSRQGVKLYLVNNDGYWIVGPRAEDEWNWQLGNGEHRLAVSQPGLWQAMQVRKNGHWVGEGGDWSWIDLNSAEVLNSREGALVDTHRFGLRVLVEVPDAAIGTLGWRWKLLVAVLAFAIIGLAGFLILRLMRSMETEALRRSELERVNGALIEAGRDMQAMQVELARVERLSSLGLMVAGVAHEMNTPLGGASLALSTAQSSLGELLRRLDTGLRRSDLDRFLADSREALAIAQAETTRAAGVVQRFKQVAMDRTTLQKRRFDLAEAILDADVRLRRWDPHQPVQLVLDLPEGLWMDSYPGPLGQVISNLLGNTLDHAFPDGRAGRISIALAADGPAWVVLRFSDNGKGIARDDLPRILEPFFTTGRHRGNTGLGLHISHQIVTEVLGGRMQVESVSANEAEGVGSGTCFTLHLPCRGPDAGPG